jgi:hypothetical protein
MVYVKKNGRLKKSKLKERLEKAVAKFEAAKKKMQEDMTLENIHEYNRASCDVGRFRQKLNGKNTKAQEYMDTYSVPNHLFI